MSLFSLLFVGGTGGWWGRLVRISCFLTKVVSADLNGSYSISKGGALSFAPISSSDCVPTGSPWFQIFKDPQHSNILNVVQSLKIDCGMHVNLES